MAIPLPRVVADVGPGGPLVTSQRGMNALTQESLENKIRGVQSDYAPYTTYADAQSKLAYANYLPWQIKAQVLSNPMLAYAFKDNPNEFGRLLKEFGQQMPSANALTSGVNMPLPSQRSQGLLSLLLNKITGNGQPQNAMNMPIPGAPNGQDMGQQGTFAAPPAQGQGNPLVPGVGGGAAGYLGSATKAGTQSPYDPGKLIPNPNQPGGVISTPTPEITASGQKAILAADRIYPILKDLSKEWKSFYTIKGVKNIVGAGIGNFLNADEATIRKWGVNPDAVSDLAEFQGTLTTAIIDSMNSFGIHQEAGMTDKVGDVLRPRIGESEKGYQNRVVKQLERIKHQQEINQQTIGSGFSISPPGQTPSAQQLSNEAATNGEGIANVPAPNRMPSDEDFAYTAKQYNMSIDKVKEMLGYK